MNLPLITLRGAALGALLALTTPLAADPLDDLVGAEQARAMGLDKLAPAERDALARWIEQQRAGGAPTAAPAGVAAASVLAVPVAAAPSAAAADAGIARAPVAAQAAPKAPVTVGSTAAFGLEQSELEGAVDKVEARIVGEFTGWDGKTVFKLDNGQVWRQSTSGVYRYKLQDPDVVIERNIFGYKLRLLETKRSIAVRRVK